MGNKYCKWEWSGGDYGSYDTECGKAFFLENGTIKEHKIKFCPFCGKEIKEEKI